MKEKKRSWTLFVIAVLSGLLIAWVDLRPNWDDTGITAFMVLGAAAFLGLAMPARPWIWALSVGIWIPLGNILLHNNYASLLALLVAFIGAYAGAFVRKIFSSRTA
jgi:hypothetical protein